MADNWELGDLAECINDDWGDDIPASSPLPARGDKLMVSGVKNIRLNGDAYVVLTFISIGPDYRYWAEHFRKINPKGEDQRIPTREAVPA